MAIPAHRQLFQHDRRRLCGGNRPKPPADVGGRVLDGRQERQVHLPKEQGGFHGVGGRADRHGGLGDHAGGITRIDAPNRDGDLLLPRTLLDGLPGVIRRRPFWRGGAEIQRFALREAELDQPRLRRGVFVVPAEGGGDDVGRKQGLVGRIQDLQGTGRGVFPRCGRGLSGCRGRTVRAGAGRLGFGAADCQKCGEERKHPADKSGWHGLGVGKFEGRKIVRKKILIFLPQFFCQLSEHPKSTACEGPDFWRQSKTPRRALVRGMRARCLVAIAMGCGPNVVW